MNTKYKQPWTAALRSGDYKQGKVRLNNGIDNSFCCLGVLCEINPDISNKSMKKDRIYNTVSPAYDGDFSYLTENLMQKFGLSQTDCLNLIIKNDKGDSFKSIASYIEKFL